MLYFIRSSKKCKLSKFLMTGLVVLQSFSLIFMPTVGYAQFAPTAPVVLPLTPMPAPGVMVEPSPYYVPVLLKGMTVDTQNPLNFHFIVDSGHSNAKAEEIKHETERLVKYFLASMTIPKNDLWVNLSPYEGERVIPGELAKTQLGRDLLAQDYLLKQLTASLMYPEKELGQAFWTKMRDMAEEKFGTRDIPVDTFNKVWILPANATVYEHEGSVYIVNSRLKVLTDADYLAVENNAHDLQSGATTVLSEDKREAAAIVREIIVPEIEREVNFGKNFAAVRQIFHSLILAKWYKETVKNSLLGAVYADQSKTAGIDDVDPSVKDEIYARYMDAYKQGVFNYIREDYDALSNTVIPRKYYSGGIPLGEEFNSTEIPVTVVRANDIEAASEGDQFDVEVSVTPQGPGAMEVSRVLGIVDAEDPYVGLEETLAREAARDRNMAAARQEISNFIDSVDGARERLAAAFAANDTAAIENELDVLNSRRILDILGQLRPAQVEWVENFSTRENVSEAMQSLKEGRVAIEIIAGGAASRMKTGLQAMGVEGLNEEDYRIWNIDIKKIIDKVAEQVRRRGHFRVEAEGVDAGIIASAQRIVDAVYQDMQNGNGSRLIPEVGENYTAGQRNLYAIAKGIDQLDIDSGTKQQIRDNLVVLIHINDDIQEQVEKDLRRFRFFGFRPENIILVNGGYGNEFVLDKNGQLVEIQSNVTWNHGFAVQELETIDGYTLWTNDRRVITDGSVFDELEKRGIQHVLARRINDGFLLHPSQAIDTQLLAAYLHFRESSGATSVMETMKNPSGQKGGLALTSDALGEFGFLLEGINSKDDAIKAKLDRLTEDAKATGGIPYNRFHLIYELSSTRRALKDNGGLPMTLKYKPTGLSPEVVTGDIALLPGVKTKMVQKQFDYLIDELGVENVPTKDGRSSYVRGQGAVIHDYKTPADLIAAAQIISGLDREESILSYSRKFPSPFDRAMSTDRRTVHRSLPEGDWAKWTKLAPNVSVDELNVDMFRDYDYRNTGPVLTPEVVFHMGLAWAKMALDKAKAAGIADRRVLVAKDARKIEPELEDALIAALRFVGLDVIYMSMDTPNAVTSYSGAVQLYRPLMSIFITASHVSQPEDIIVRGFKVAQVKEQGGNILSLSTREIKKDSLELTKALINGELSLSAVEAPIKGTFTGVNVDEDVVRINALVGRVAASGGSLYELARAFKDPAKDPKAVLIEFENRYRDAGQPLEGMRIVVEGSHTPSGHLAAKAFEDLGAQVLALNDDIQEISGLHNADPSIDSNLADLKASVSNFGAHFGIAFDLDGDRGAILIPEKNSRGEISGFHTLAPDNLIVNLVPSFIEKWGYDVPNSVGVIRDVLGTFGVNNAAEQAGIETFQTDAGYVFLKALKEEKEKDGYVFPIYGERSGHTWLDVTGEIENPVAVTILFALLARQQQAEHFDALAADPKSDGVVLNPVLDTYKANTIPYAQSPRFQPLFHPEFLKRLSADPRNTTGWTYDETNPTKPPQAIIALGKDTAIRALSEAFRTGNQFVGTPVGTIRVKEFNSFQDSAEDGGLFRFADIVFENIHGQLVGRFVFRASSNDPSFVASYEAPQLEGESAEDAKSKRAVVGGVVLDFVSNKKIALVSREDIQASNPRQTEEQVSTAFNKGNLGLPSNDMAYYRGDRNMARDLPVGAGAYYAMARDLLSRVEFSSQLADIMGPGEDLNSPEIRKTLENALKELEGKPITYIIRAGEKTFMKQGVSSSVGLNIDNMGYINFGTLANIVALRHQNPVLTSVARRDVGLNQDAFSLPGKQAIQYAVRTTFDGRIQNIQWREHGADSRVDLQGNDLVVVGRSGASLTVGQAARLIDKAMRDRNMSSEKDDVGGIDFNNVGFTRTGDGIDVQYDPELIRVFMNADIDGFSPVILNVTPLTSVLPILGLSDDDTETRLSALRNHKPAVTVNRIAKLVAVKEEY